MLALELIEQPDAGLRFVLTEAGERLVEQQQLRPGGERDGDLQQPLLAVRETAGADVGPSLQANAS